MGVRRGLRAELVVDSLSEEKQAARDVLVVSSGHRGTNQTKTKPNRTIQLTTAMHRTALPPLSPRPSPH